jgi:hypothetical protein
MDISVPYIGPAEVSSEDARLLLDTYNIGNRIQRQADIRFLAYSIQNGEWKEDHPQSISFSSKRLLDGQHRLEAIALSGVTVICRVELGVRDELREYIDIGIPRQLHERCRFFDDPSDNRAACHICNAFYWIPGGNDKRKPTTIEAGEIFSKHRQGIKFAVGYRSQRATAIVLTCAVEMYERDAIKAKQFMDDFVSRDGTIQQARRLREYWLGSRKGTARLTRHTNYMKTVGAMKAFLEGRLVSSLRACNWSD